MSENNSHDPQDNRRRERRYKTNLDQTLSCRIGFDDPGEDRVWDGTAVDISQSGLRILTDGTFKNGQPIWIDLNSIRSHGIYRGNVRRIEPWVGGQWILGCSLRDSIPNEVLQELAGEGIINRRTDGRFSLSQRATISWPLQPEEIEVEIQDYSTGGLKVLSAEPIPGSARLRVQCTSGGQEVTVEAKSIWSRVAEDGWVTGLAFTERDAPARIVKRFQELSEAPSDSEVMEQRSLARRAITVALCIAFFGYALITSF